jgi:hypothetical protein
MYVLLLNVNVYTGVIIVTFSGFNMSNLAKLTFHLFVLGSLFRQSTDGCATKGRNRHISASVWRSVKC